MEQMEATRSLLAKSQQRLFPYAIRFSGLAISVFKGVFSPAHFNGWRVFTRHFPAVRGKRVLEIGCGTGVTALVLAKRGAAHVMAVDIDPRAVRNAEENARRNRIANTEVRRSDIFSDIRPQERFDVIYWNMPFLSVPRGYRWRSGLERAVFDPGYATLDRFLNSARAHLLPHGSVLIGWGDFGDARRLVAKARKRGYSVSLLAKQGSREVNSVEFQLYRLRAPAPARRCPRARS